MDTSNGVNRSRSAAPVAREKGVKPTAAIAMLWPAQERLRDNAENFRLLIESILDYAIFMLDAGGRVASWNAGAHRLKGYREDEIIGHHFSRFYPRQDIEQGKPQHALKLASAEGRFEDEGWRVRKNGS